jgi:hypothetical protein
MVSRFILITFCPDKGIPGNGFGVRNCRRVCSVDMGLLSPGRQGCYDEWYRDNYCK